jgi:hypothetical protein
MIIYHYFNIQFRLRPLQLRRLSQRISERKRNPRKNRRKGRKRRRHSRKRMAMRVRAMRNGQMSKHAKERLLGYILEAHLILH